MLGTIAKYVLPIAAAGLLAFAVAYVLWGKSAPTPAAPPLPPPTTPFRNTVAAAGMVEAETENIEVGAPTAGIVVELFVEVGDRVEIGAPLFRLDDRALKAELATRQAELASAQAELARLRAAPRPEEVPVREAALAEARAMTVEALDRVRRLRPLVETGAVTQEEFVQAQQQYNSAAATERRAAAELHLLKEGTWKYALDVAEAQTAEAQARVRQAETELERLTVRALVEGEVLQVNVRPGEYVSAQPSGPLILLGGTRQLHVRVDIDEYDIPRFETSRPAVATLKGDPDVRFPLEFVRVEPYVVPKRSLTNENTERVDTRVLQVIYEIAKGGDQLYVGQQLDVFIQAAGPKPHAPASYKPDAQARENR